MSKQIFHSLFNHRLELLNRYSQNESLENEEPRSHFNDFHSQLWFFSVIDQIHDSIPNLKYNEKKTLAENAYDSVSVYFDYPIFEGWNRSYKITMSHEGSTWYINAENEKPKLAFAMDILEDLGAVDDKHDMNTNKSFYQPQTQATCIRKINQDIEQFSHPKYYRDTNYILYIRKTSISHDVPNYPELQNLSLDWKDKRRQLQRERKLIYEVDFTYFYLFNIKKKEVESIGFSRNFEGTQFEKHFDVSHINAYGYKNKQSEAIKVLFQPTHVVKTYTKFLRLNNLTKDDVYIDRDNDVWRNSLKLPSTIEWNKVISRFIK
jgi:hypothetical protein